MKIIEYKKNESNYCLVHKTRLYIQYLIVIENKAKYFFTFQVKNYHRTKKICEKILKTKNLTISLRTENSFELINRHVNHNYKTEYNIIVSALGEEQSEMVRLYHGDKKIIGFKEINKSPTFAYGYFFHLFDHQYSSIFHTIIIESCLDFFKPHKDKKAHAFLLRYTRFLVKKFINYNFDIRCCFEFFDHCDQSFRNKYYVLLYQELDKYVKLDVDKIMEKFNIASNEQKFGMLYYYVNHIFDIYYQYYLGFIEDKKAKISYVACSFDTPIFYNHCREIMAYDNLELIKLNFKRYSLFFVDNKFKDQFAFLENKIHKVYERNRVKAGDRFRELCRIKKF